MRTLIILVSILLIVWISGSSYVYVCKIRKNCVPEETSLADSSALKMTVADTLKAIPVPEMLTLYFDFNISKCEITVENTNHFELIKQYLDANPDKKILVTGHSDIIGSEAAKEKIGVLRAEFTGQNLTSAGIASEVIEMKSESDRKPVADNSTDEGRAKNRRAEITIQ